MRLNTIWRILAAVLLGSLACASLQSCQEEKEDLGPASVTLSEGELTFGTGVGETVIEITATRDWATYSFPDWIAVTPDHGTGSTKPQPITVVVLPNPDMDRSTNLVFTIGLSKVKLPVTQRGEGGSLEEALIFKNDFDKEVATQTYGSSGTSWPYLDQFDGWRNETGNGIEDLSYEFASLSVRNNSNSDGSYSDYDGSGLNNLLFAAGNKFVIKNIDIHDARSFALTFGTEKYSSGSEDNTFQHSEFHVYVSDNGERWVELEYTFPNGEKSGRWDIATSKFTVPDETGELYLYFRSDLASGHRMDDVVLMRSGSTSDPIDFTQGTAISAGSGSDIYDKEAVYYNDFDKTISTQTFGSSGSSWPFLDQFDGWNNEKGTGIGDLKYAYNAMSVRSNSNSNAGYSDYKGSGNNNLMFGSGSFLSIGNIDLGGKTALTLEFGTEKYMYGVTDNTFDHSEFHVFLSDDGQKWVEVEYAFPSGDKNGRWDLAAVSFNVPSATTHIWVYFKSDIASGHRLDDVQLRAADTAPSLTLDFTQGTDITGGGSGLDTKDAIFYNDFDKSISTQTYGSGGGQWPFMDQFDGWRNEKGSGIANLTYATKGITVRSNSASNSSYSDYPGSGDNNLMFGTDGFIAVGNLDLGGNTALTVSFGSEKYWYGSSDNTFVHSDVHLYVSADGQKWVPLEYTFEKGDPNGRWDLATSSFNVPAGTSTLHLYVGCDLAGQYRLDDLLLAPAKTTPALTIGWDNGVELDLGTGGNTGIDTSNAIYYDDFDKSEAPKTFGNGDSWPYLDQFEGWKNPSGSGASDLTYGFRSISARSNSTSDSQYSDYPGSGTNNLFFGSDAFFWVGGIDLSGQERLNLSFGSEKYLNNTSDNTFDHSEFLVYVSDDGQRWIRLDYAFDGGDKNGRWAYAGTEFQVPATTTKLYIYFTSTLASAHRLDDVLLAPSTSAGEVVQVDFGRGVTLDTDGSSTGGGGGSGYEAPVDPVTIAQMVQADKGAVVAAEEVYVAAVTTRGFVVTDRTANVYVYEDQAPGVKVGDKVNFYGTKDDYYGMPEITSPVYEVVSSGNEVPYGNPQDITSTFDTYTSTSYDYISFSATVVKNGNYTNFQVEGASTYVGSLSSAPSSMYDGLDEGKAVVVYGYFNGHNDKNKLLNVIAVRITNADGSDIGAGGGGGGETPSGSFASTVPWTLGTNAYEQDATVNGTSGVTVLKLGTSKAVGSATITLPAGTKALTFYGVAWKNAATSLSIKDASGAPVFTQAVSPNDGATGNPTYTLSVSDSDSYTWTLPAPLTAASTYTVTTEGDNPRIILFALNALTQ